jgi:hypothetical protein
MPNALAAGGGSGLPLTLRVTSAQDAEEVLAAFLTAEGLPAKEARNYTVDLVGTVAEESEFCSLSEGGDGSANWNVPPGEDGTSVVVREIGLTYSEGN